MLINRIGSALIWITLFLGIAFHSLAQTEGGLVEGSIEDGITVYRGIPFAAPPVGDLRWRAPQPVEPWEGVLEAREFCPACPQPANFITALFTQQGTSEDCLYLNIWKPGGYKDKKLPVLVWIYGGGFNMGSTSQDLTTGEQLARKGVVVVSMGYRLGALGFLAASPLVKGLFQRAICMSGGYFRPSSLKKLPEYTRTLEGAEADGLEIARQMGANTLEELRAADPEEFLDKPLLKLANICYII